MHLAHPPGYYVLIAVLSLVSCLVFEAIFDDEISWLTVILTPFGVIAGLIVGDTLRHRRGTT